MSNTKNAVIQKIAQALDERGIIVRRESERQLYLSWAEKEADIYLDNLWKQISEQPEKTAYHIERFLMRILEICESNKQEYSKYWPRLIPYQSKKTMMSPWVQPLIPKYIDIAIVEEKEGYLRYLQPMDLVNQSLALQHLKQQCFVNLSEAYDILESQEIDDGIWAIEDENGLASAMILLLGWKQNMSDQWIAMPTKNQLWICENRQKQQEFQHKVLHAFQAGAYPLSGAVFVWNHHFKMFFTEI